MASYKSKRPKNRIIPIEAMSEVFEYDPRGIIVTKTNRTNSPKGVEVGFTLPTGYRQLVFEGRNYYVHRVIWALCKKEQPIEIDHVNAIKSDNRIENLMSVSRSENAKNFYSRKEL